MTAPLPKANPNLLYLGLDCSDLSLAMKRHLRVRMSHQIRQTLACGDLLAGCSGLAMRGVGGVRRGRSEQKVRLRCLCTVLCCRVLIERKLLC